MIIVLLALVVVGLIFARALSLSDPWLRSVLVLFLISVGLFLSATALTLAPWLK